MVAPKTRLNVKVTFQPNSIFALIDQPALLACMRRYSKQSDIDVERAVQLANDGIMAARNSLPPERRPLTLQHELEARWYSALTQGGLPDYAIYAHPYYVCDLWACWRLYSHKYLRGLLTAPVFANRETFVQRYGSQIHTIVDLGCGLGYSTAALKELLPSATVFGTNLIETPQCQFAIELGVERQFTVVESTAKIEQDIDLLFASEYFEHFEDPVTHLDLIFQQRRLPKILVFASSFGAIGAGHFVSHVHDGVSTPGKNFGRTFNAELRARGYTQPAGRYWNAKPAVWELQQPQTERRKTNGN